MFSKYFFRMATAMLLSSFFSSTAYAINISSLLTEIAGDVTVVTADGVCSANPYNGSPACLPTKVTCPTGKIPVLVKCTATNVAGARKFKTSKSNIFTTATQIATGYATCTSMSISYYDNSTGYHPARAGYTPLCNLNTKACTGITYRVTARCITSPKKLVIDKLGIKRF